jgi:hypothetical protein
MADSTSLGPGEYADRWRLILLLDACEAANLCPIPLARIHALAFLSNVLAPVWSTRSYDGKILKRRGGPFYPELQAQLDRLVGLGFVTISNLSHTEENGQWTLAGSFALNEDLTRPVLSLADVFTDEQITREFFRRLTYATSRLTRSLESVVEFDATWSDNRTGEGDVVDFAEWRRANYSAFTANFFEKLTTTGSQKTAGDKLQMYMLLLDRRREGSAKIGGVNGATRSIARPS